MVLVWLWCRQGATALIQPPAWEFSYATCEALKRQKKKKKKEKSFTEVPSWGSCHGAPETNPSRNHEVAGSIPCLAQ